MKYHSKHARHSLSMAGAKPINFEHGEFSTNDPKVQAWIESLTAFKHGVISRAEASAF